MPDATAVSTHRTVDLIDAADRPSRGSIATLMVVAAPDLTHVDTFQLRRASEELAVALQMASASLGLQRPTLEAQTR
jgi:hypothetical protein